MNFLEINISNLPEACQQPDILNLIALFQKILDIVFLILPIALIVLITIDVTKIIISSDEKTSKTNTKTIITRTIFAVLLFFVPTIITVVMNVTGNSLGQNLSEFSTCMIAAESKDTRDQVKALYDQKMEEYKEKLRLQTEARKQLKGSKYEKLAHIMVENAKKELNSGYKPTSTENKYCKDQGWGVMAWCDIFVTWLAKKTEYEGMNLFDDVLNKNKDYTVNEQRGVGNTRDFFSDEKNGFKFHTSKYNGGTYTPKPGDFIIYGSCNSNAKEACRKKPYNDNSFAEHIGLVVEVTNSTIHTIEGNWNVSEYSPGMVVKREIPINNYTVLGYCSWYNN